MFISGSSDGGNKHLYKLKAMLQDISSGEGDCATEVGAMCACFVDMGAPVKTQAENGLSKLFKFWGQTIDVSDQNIFTLKYFGINDK